MKDRSLRISALKFVFLTKYWDRSKISSIKGHILSAQATHGKETEPAKGNLDRFMDFFFIFYFFPWIHSKNILMFSIQLFIGDFPIGKTVWETGFGVPLNTSTCLLREKKKNLE